MTDKTGKEDNLITISDKVNVKVRTPKNVRQIGKIGDGLKIYVEDYVKTYTKQLAEGDFTNRCIAVLVGEYRSNDLERNVFLYGAIKVEVNESEQLDVFTEDTWTTIYEKIKEYFPDAEIVGWYYGGTGLGPEDLEALEQIQINNFAGRDKVLFTYDVLEKENNIYLFDGISMNLQPGYYIYYEKNEEMQNYMVDHKKIKREEEEVDDHAIQEMRTILSEKKPAASSEKEQKFLLRLGYAAGTLMLIVALIVGVTMFNNSRRMNEMEGDIQVMKNNIFEKVEDPISEDKETIVDGKDEPVALAEVTKAPDNEEIILTPTVAPQELEVSPTPVAQEPTQSLTTPTVEPVPTAVPVMNIDPAALIEYTVKEGDTLASICINECGSYGMITTIKELNQIADENIIYIGQVLLIPKKGE